MAGAALNLIVDSAAPPQVPGIIKSICILDDDLSVLSSLQELLDSDGLEARTFNSPDQFLAYAKGHAVTLAILDVWMPETNGIEVQERLHELSPATQVIMITGREEAPIRASALERGAVAFLVKPFHDETFLELVRKAVCEPT
jgi:FixJ family two-component response regulator